MINWLHLHLILNHVPGVAVLFGLGLLLLGLWKKSDDLAKTGLAIFVLVGLITFLVYFSGDFGDDQLTNLSEISKKFLTAHQNIASFTLIATNILGLLGFIGMVLFSKLGGRTGIYVKVIMLASVMVFVILVRTANLGGKITHSEIREDIFIFQKE